MPKMLYRLSATKSYTKSPNGVGNNIPKPPSVGSGGFMYSAILNTASDFTYARVGDTTKTMLEISSAFLPQSRNIARPTSLCNAAKRTDPDALASISIAKFTPPLHKLHTPSYKITGRVSPDVKNFVVVVVVDDVDVDASDADDALTRECFAARRSSVLGIVIVRTADDVVVVVVIVTCVSE